MDDQPTDTIVLKGLGGNDINVIEDFCSNVGVIHRVSEEEGLFIVTRKSADGSGLYEAEVVFEENEAAQAAKAILNGQNIRFGNEEYTAVIELIEPSYIEKEPLQELPQSRAPAQKQVPDQRAFDSKTKIVTPERLYDDWLCPRCRAQNYSKRIECYKCHESKPANPQIVRSKAQRPAFNPRSRDNYSNNDSGYNQQRHFDRDAPEWVCPKCKNSNWARRTACNRCHAERPPDARQSRGRRSYSRSPSPHRDRQPRMSYDRSDRDGGRDRSHNYDDRRDHHNYDRRDNYRRSPPRDRPFDMPPQQGYPPQQMPMDQSRGFMPGPPPSNTDPRMDSMPLPQGSSLFAQMEYQQGQPMPAYQQQGMYRDQNYPPQMPMSNYGQPPPDYGRYPPDDRNFQVRDPRQDANLGQGYGGGQPGGYGGGYGQAQQGMYGYGGEQFGRDMGRQGGY